MVSNISNLHPSLGQISTVTNGWRMITNQVTVIKKDMAQFLHCLLFHCSTPPAETCAVTAGATTGDTIRFGVQLSKYDCYTVSL